jgi:tRNA pseudouridine synthase 10
MQFNRNNAGRYNKLARGISNSKWLHKGERLAEDSVEELIGSVTDSHFRNDKHMFSSAGREDADVLMLGRGRPFYIELVNPKRSFMTQEEVTKMQEEINEKSKGKIVVRDLQIVSRWV